MGWEYEHRGSCTKLARRFVRAGCVRVDLLLLRGASQQHVYRIRDGAHGLRRDGARHLGKNLAGVFGRRGRAAEQASRLPGRLSRSSFRGRS